MDDSFWQVFQKFSDAHFGWFDLWLSWTIPESTVIPLYTVTFFSKPIGISTSPVISFPRTFDENNDSRGNGITWNVFQIF